MLKRTSCFIASLLLLLCLAGCENASITPSVTPKLNGIALSEYTIIYDQDDVDYNRRAAQYIQGEIQSRIGLSLPIRDDNSAESTYEIVVGETNRDISSQLDAQTGTNFAILADDNRIALEGEYFTIAAAAYYFVETYITDTACEAVIPKETMVHSPIVKEAKSVIFLIGDGMGQYQSRLFDYLSVPAYAVSDGENQFYGYMLPAKGLSRTDSLSGTTDSAAGGTALSTGFKTNNGYIGKDQSHKVRQSLTDLAISMGKATAIMSTEVQTGATPASFSAHADDRSHTNTIYSNQMMLKNRYGTIFSGNLKDYNNSDLEREIATTLSAMEDSENGFFLMYEEAHIDGACHNQDVDQAFVALIRFNQAIGLFMEYAFYHPDTFVLITADHETGSMGLDSSGKIVCNTGVHSSSDVPVFAYGHMSECFNNKVVENIQIPKTIAKLWGVEKFGSENAEYPPLF